MTDKLHDTQKAAGRASGRTHNRHTEQATGTGRQQETHGSHGTHNRQERTGSEREGRQEGREERGARMASRLGSDGDKRSTAAGREQGETERKRVCNIFKGEKERKTPMGLANTHRQMNIHCT